MKHDDEWCPLVEVFKFIDSLPGSRGWIGHDDPGPSEHPPHYGRRPGPEKPRPGRYLPAQGAGGKFLPRGTTETGQESRSDRQGRISGPSGQDGTQQNGSGQISAKRETA